MTTAFERLAAQYAAAVAPLTAQAAAMVVPSAPILAFVESQQQTADRIAAPMLQVTEDAVAQIAELERTDPQWRDLMAASRKSRTHSRMVAVLLRLAEMSPTPRPILPGVLLALLLAAVAVATSTDTIAPIVLLAVTLVGVLVTAPHGPTVAAA
jgi:hypothetical protein